MTAALPLSRLAEAAHALGRAPSRACRWVVISDLLQDLFGHRLFTALVYLKAQRLMGRIYTSDESISPWGFKATGKGPWSSRVLDQGLSYIGHDEADIRSVFSEADSLIASGLHAVLNIPVWCGGEVVGTLNLLSHQRAYAEVAQPLLELVAALCAPVFLLEKEAVLGAVSGLDTSLLECV